MTTKTTERDYLIKKIIIFKPIKVIRYMRKDLYNVFWDQNEKKESVVYVLYFGLISCYQLVFDFIESPLLKSLDTEYYLQSLTVEQAVILQKI